MSEVDVATLLNSASIASDNEKIELLSSAFELMNYRDASLFSEYYPSLIQFALDSTVQIKKQIIGFIETTCKNKPQFIVKSKDILKYLLCQSQQVIKRSILCFTNIIRSTLSYTLTSLNNDVEDVWNSFNEIRKYILDPSCSNLSINDATISNSFKLLEILVLCFSQSNESFLNTSPSQHQQQFKIYKSDDEFSLDRVPNSHPILNRLQLQKECSTYLNTMLDHIISLDSMTSTNIMTLITSLTSICKQRFSLMKVIIPQLSQCTQYLPKFNTIQNESIKHTIKICFLSILKLKNTVISPFVQELSKALSSIDVSSKEIEEASKWYRGEPDKKKRQIEQNNNENIIKKVKSEPNNSNNNNNNNNNSYDNGYINDNRLQTSNSNNFKQGIYIDNETQLKIISSLESLRPEYVADLIIDNMSISPFYNCLKSIQYSQNTEKLFQFVNSYQLQPPAQQQNQQITPPRVYTDPRKKGESPPLSSTPPPPPSTIAPSMPILEPTINRQSAVDDIQPILSPTSTSTSNINKPIITEYEEEPELDQLLVKDELVSENTDSNSQVDSKSITATPLDSMAIDSSGKSNEKNVINNNHNETTEDIPPTLFVAPKPIFKIPTLGLDQVSSIIDRSLSRLRQSEKGATLGGKKLLWSSLFARLLSVQDKHETNLNLHNQVIDFILDDFVNRRELALQWLQNEYQLTLVLKEDDDDQANRYTQLLINFVKKLQAKFAFDDDSKHQMLVSDFILEVPVITSGLMDHIALCCDDTTLVSLGLNTLLNLILWRPISRDQCLQCLFKHSIDSNDYIRTSTVQIIRDSLFSHTPLEQKIETFVIEQLLSILPQPDQDQSISSRQSTVNKLLLYFSICEKKPSLLAELVECYPKCTDSVKEMILEKVGSVVSSIGQTNESLLLIIRVCPQGSEQLLYQIIDSLSTTPIPAPTSDVEEQPTDQTTESDDKKKDSQISTTTLSKEFIQSVRLLSNTTKDVKFLLPIVYGLEKEEIINLLPTFVQLPLVNIIKFVEMISMKQTPLSQSELLVQLHLIMNSENTVQVIQTIDTCIKNTEKQETLAVTIQQLLVQPVLPKTIMRTMLQALQKFSHLKQFIADVLRELVAKQIWQDPQLWKGFLICSTKATPESLNVILDLPSTQFEMAINDSSELKSLLLKFLKTVKDPTNYSRNNLRLIGFQQSNKK